MDIYSKLFGKKRTVNHAAPAAQQQNAQIAAAQNGQNAQAQLFNDFEIVNQPGDGQPVAEVYLNVDTESKSRSHMSVGELFKGEVHRQKRASKEGPDGKNVRVKGVKDFEMEMYTDPAEIVLRRAADLHDTEMTTKSEFAQLLFISSSSRTPDAAKSYADEAVKIGLMIRAERDAVVRFYENGFNVIDDPTSITTHPDFFKNYITDISDAMPNSETFYLLMNGRTISDKFDIKRLVKQLM